MKYILLLVLALAPDSVRIKLQPQVVYAGNTVLVTCSVPRQANNRELTALLPNYTYSTRQLDGEATAITHRFEFKQVPCGVSEARCIVVDAYNNKKEAVANLQVAGCEP